MKANQWLACLTLTAALPAAADFAEIRDADGHSNIRAEANTQSRVLDRIANGRFVYLHPKDVEPEQNGWRFVGYTDSKGREKNGWVHSSRIKRVADLPSMRQQKSQRGFSCRNSEAELFVEMGKFDYQANQKHFGRETSDDGVAFLTTYKGKPMYGTDGQKPETAYTSVTLVQNGRRHSINPAAFEHLFNPYFTEADKGIDQICHYDAARKRLYWQAGNGDGAGFYAVLFVFENGRLHEVLPLNLQY